MGYQSEIQTAELAATLDRAGQSHVLTFLNDLEPAQRDTFLAQIATLDWPLIAKLAATVVQHPEKLDFSSGVEPAPYLESAPTDPAKIQHYKTARARGEQLLREGKIAAFVVAGGQGTRLGWDAPKGTFPASPIKHKPLFQYFAEFLRALGNRHNHSTPLYIMTSPMNHVATTTYWKKHNHFGLNPADIMFFPQDSLPAFAFDGKVLLEEKDSLALSPNGHGGSLLALYKSGAIADMKKRGITQISYFQVDNPIVRCVDPLFIGLHDLAGAQMSSKMLPKVAPKEKLGNFALVHGKMSVIEYSDLPDSLAEQRLPNGQLRFRAGSIALHAIRVDFVESLNTRKGGFALPYHRAEKKVPCIDLSTGNNFKPDKPNAIKCETFVFDALPLTTTSIIYETNRQDEFAPIKNPEGIDSAVSSVEITNRRNAEWLEKAAHKVPRKSDGSPDCLIEIAPSFALYPEDVIGKNIPPIKPGDKIYLE